MREVRTNATNAELRLHSNWYDITVPNPVLASPTNPNTTNAVHAKMSPSNVITLPQASAHGWRDSSSPVSREDGSNASEGWASDQQAYLSVVVQ